LVSTKSFFLLDDKVITIYGSVC